MKRVALYARVSTEGQDAGLQLDRLRTWAGQAGVTVTHVAVEVASGRLVRRPKMDEVMSLARGHRINAVAVVKLDRWGRNLIDVKTSIEELVAAGVEFHAIDQGIVCDKKSPQGTFYLSMLGAVAEFEADLIRDRTKEALAAIKATGRSLGRPRLACSLCGGPRHDDTRGKVRGVSLPLCLPCKATAGTRGKENGMANAQGGDPPKTGGTGNGHFPTLPVVGRSQIADDLWAVQETGAALAPADLEKEPGADA